MVLADGALRRTAASINSSASARRGKLGLHAARKLDRVAARRLALGEPDGDVARALGHAEIDRIDEREGDRRDDVEERMPFAGLAPHRHRRLGHHMAVDHDVMRAGAAHAERAPGVEHLHVRRVHRHAEVQHHRRLAFGFEDGAGHQEVAGGRAGGEDLARGDAIAAVHLLGLAGAADPVRPAARQEQDALAGDALQQRLDGCRPSDASSARPGSRPGGCASRTRAPVEPQ